MGIEISNNNAALLSNSYGSTAVQPGRNDSTNQQNETGRPSHTDTVTMTEAAQTLSKASQVIAEIPVVDRQRVDNVLDRLTKDRFAPDYQQLADKLMEYENTIHGSQPAGTTRSNDDTYP